MGKVSLKSRNLNRFKKVYPYTRAAPRFVYYTNEEFVLESAVLSFSGSDTVTYTFINSYDAAPSVVATALSDAFNVSVISVTTLAAVIKASIPNESSVSIVVVAT
jgi:ribosomal protein L23